ncbi:hypothetical protein P4O66_017955 [Electrophorus voltai]|uniref:Uncharacterized protein n=1 Tax=Electrophorus voltai TaxID=2609070 RepID=A0AAD9DMX7_9TELE|nr:hypothetical protein P4O66_017955 [Electrophorus voltai]
MIYWMLYSDMSRGTATCVCCNLDKVNSKLQGFDGSGRCITRKISSSQWMQHVTTQERNLVKAGFGFFSSCLAMERIACVVDEVLWPDLAHRYDAEAE